MESRFTCFTVCLFSPSLLCAPPPLTSSLSFSPSLPSFESILFILLLNLLAAHHKKFPHLQSADQVHDIFHKERPAGTTDLAGVLHSAFKVCSYERRERQREDWRDAKEKGSEEMGIESGNSEILTALAGALRWKQANNYTGHH